MPDQGWTELLRAAGIETPGYEEAVQATMASIEAKLLKAQQEREAKKAKRSKKKKSH